MKNYAFVVLNLEKFWTRLCSQNRAGKPVHAFVRRGKVGPKSAERLFFYVTNPRKDIQGYADFIERVTGDAKDLWQSLGHESLLSSFEEYQDFLQGRKTATFIRFKNLKEFPKPVKANTWTKLFGRKRLPQMGLYLSEKTSAQLLAEGGVTA